MKRTGKQGGLLLLTFAGLLSACTTVQSSDEKPVAQLASERATTDAEMRIFFANKCPVNPVAKESLLAGVGLSILADTVGKVVGSGIDALGKYLSSEQAISFSENTRMEGFAGSENGKLAYNRTESCLIVVIAKNFDAVKPADNAWKAYDPLPNLVREGSESIKRDIYDKTKLGGPALFYMELTPYFSGDASGTQSAFSYKTQTFYYPAFISPGGARFSAARDVMMRLEISTPGQTSPFGAFEWQWHGVKSGAISESSVVGKKLPWSPLPEGVTTAATKAKTKTNVPVYPVNVKMMLTETAKPYVILKYVGDALAAQKDNIVHAAQDAANQAFSEQARTNARLASVTDVGKKFDEYAAAYDAASTAQEKYANAAAGAAKQKALVAAKLAYAKLRVAESNVRIMYSNAELGGFEPLPDLPVLP